MTEIPEHLMRRAEAARRRRMTGDPSILADSLRERAARAYAEGGSAQLVERLRAAGLTEAGITESLRLLEERLTSISRSGVTTTFDHSGLGRRSTLTPEEQKVADRIRTEAAEQAAVTAEAARVAAAERVAHMNRIGYTVTAVILAVLILAVAFLLAVG